MNKNLDKKITDFLNHNRDNLIKDLQDLIKIDSTYSDDDTSKPYGSGNAKALDFMMNLCQDTGLECRNIDYYCMDATCGTGEEVVASLSHLDIVPVGDGWSYDPLGGEIDGDLIYGRGTSDDKGPLIASLYAVKALLSADVELKRKIRLIFGCDEERGMSDMRYYLQKCKAPDYAFSPDAYFPVIHAEKTLLGGKYKTQVKGKTIVSKIYGGSRTNVVPGSATAIVSQIGSHMPDPDIVIEDSGDNFAITATGISAHASKPEDGRSAFTALFKFLIKILPEDDAYWELTSKLYKAFAATDGSGMGINCSDDATGALTLNLGIINGDENEFECDFDIRHPVTLDEDKTHGILKDSLNGFELVYFNKSKGLYWPIDHPLIKTLQSVYQDITGDSSAPITMGGGTYARTLPCAVAFGPAFPSGKAKGAHMSDECTSIEELMQGARIYAHALYELANM